MSIKLLSLDKTRPAVISTCNVIKYFYSLKVIPGVSLSVSIGIHPQMHTAHCLRGVQKPFQTGILSQDDYRLNPSDVMLDGENAAKYLYRT